MIDLIDLIDLIDKAATIPTARFFWDRVLFFPPCDKMSFERWGVSPMLVFSTTLLAVSAFNYGFSDQAFSSSQAMDSFTRQFGAYDESTGEWALEPLFTSLYNSIKAGGQIIG